MGLSLPAKRCADGIFISEIPVQTVQALQRRGQFPLAAAADQRLHQVRKPRLRQEHPQGAEAEDHLIVRGFAGGKHDVAPVPGPAEGVRVGVPHREGSQQLAEFFMAKGHQEVLALEHQEQLRGVVPAAWPDAGLLAADADLHFQGAGAEGFPHGGDGRADLVREAAQGIKVPVPGIHAQGEDGLQAGAGEDAAQHRIRDGIEIESPAGQGAQEAFGVVLGDVRRQLRPERRQPRRQVIPCQAEGAFQVGGVHGLTGLHLPGQEFGGDGQQHLQAGETHQLALAAVVTPVRCVQQELEGLPGERRGAEGLAEDQLAVELAQGLIRIGGQTEVLLPDGAVLQAGVHQAFGEGIDGGFFGGGPVLQALDQVLRKTQGQLAQHGSTPVRSPCVLSGRNIWCGCSQSDMTVIILNDIELMT